MSQLEEYIIGDIKHILPKRNKMDDLSQFKHSIAVNLESDKHIVCVKILNGLTKDETYSKTIQFMKNYVKNFVVRNNGLTHYTQCANLAIHEDLDNSNLKDGYYILKDSCNTKYIVYNVETEILPGYIYNGVNRTIKKVFELYANSVGDIDLIKLDKEINFNDVITELSEHLEDNFNN